MTASDIIQELSRRGVQLEASGDRLRFRPAGVIPPDLLERIKQHKVAIIEALTGDKQPGLCPGPEKCTGCYSVAPGIAIHPPKCSQDWLDWLRRWQLGNGRPQ